MIDDRKIFEFSAPVFTNAFSYKNMLALADLYLLGWGGMGASIINLIT
jgi:hypothetical protein